MLSQALSKTKVCPEFAYIQQIQLANIYDLVVETPVSTMKKLSDRFGVEIFLKREDRQPVHSFKLRGAHNKLTQLTAAERSLGVIAASAGNHAQGVALSSAELGIRATIVMPMTTPEIKVQAVRNLGATVVLHGKNFDEANQYAIAQSQQSGCLFIPPFDDEKVIAGQGTAARELLGQIKKIDAVFIPVGGGGLLAGMAVYIKSLAPNIKVYGVEAKDSACFKAALEHGEPVDLAHVGIFADGVAVKRMGRETFRLAKQYCDGVITVSSDEICAAMKDIFDDVRAIAEPAGALALAGMKRFIHKQQDRGIDVVGMRMVSVLSGANMNFDNLRYVSERTEIGEKREAILAVTIDETYGSFHKFSQALAGQVITEFNYRKNGTAKAHIFVGVKLRHGSSELAELKRRLELEKYAFVDLSKDEVAKSHIRHMVGGVASGCGVERVISFEFPEYPGALREFLEQLGQDWSISMFHYRNHGAAVSSVLAGFELSHEQNEIFDQRLDHLGFDWRDQSDNHGYQLFLRN